VGEDVNPTEHNPYCFAIVDDEPPFAQLVGDTLSSSGAMVEVFRGGLDFLKNSNLMRFKSIVLDLSLPDIDGFDLMKDMALKARGMPVVLMSGHDISVVHAAKIYGNAIGLNVCAALTKPFTRDELFCAVGLRA
jgi:FixJ family two-component response regulator